MIFSFSSRRLRGCLVHYFVDEGSLSAKALKQTSTSSTMSNSNEMEDLEQVNTCSESEISTKRFAINEDVNVLFCL